jgi:hypothetical protein
MTTMRVNLKMTALAAISTIALGIAAASAKDVYLAAMPLCIMPETGDTTVCTGGIGLTDPVPMWGFAELTLAQYNASDIAAAVPTVPGPVIMVTPADLGSPLNIHLLNTLPVPVSIVVPSLPGALSPVFIDGTGAVTGTGSRAAGDVTSRIRSLNTEAAPSGGKVTYTFPTTKPGSFLYQSGTNQAIQVPMGLYGAVAVMAGNATAYPDRPETPAVDAISFVRQVTLFYSEVDTDFNRNVQPDAAYGGVLTGMSVRNYAPKFFYTTSRSFDSAGVALPPGLTTAIPINVPSLLRMYSGGLRTHAPALQTRFLDVVAEDGNRLPFAQRGHTVLLPAGQTKDALILPPIPEQIHLVDRMRNMNAAGSPQQAQGMATVLDVSNVSSAIIASPETIFTSTGVLVTANVLANDFGDPSQPGTLQARLITSVPAAAGTLSVAAGAVFNGNVTFTPQFTVGPNNTAGTGFSGTTTFTYRVEQVNGATIIGTSGNVTATLSVAPHTAPIAVADGPFATTSGIGVPLNLLANDNQNGALPAGVNYQAQLLDADSTTAANSADGFEGFTVLPAGTSGGGVGSLSVTPGGGANRLFNGITTFTPANAFAGTVTMRYRPVKARASDNAILAAGAIQTITIAVTSNPVPANPVANTFTISRTNQAANPQTIAAPGVLGNDTLPAAPAGTRWVARLVDFDGTLAGGTGGAIAGFQAHSRTPVPGPDPVLSIVNLATGGTANNPGGQTRFSGGFTFIPSTDTVNTVTFRYLIDLVPISTTNPAQIVNTALTQSAQAATVTITLVP